VRKVSYMLYAIANGEQLKKTSLREELLPFSRSNNHCVVLNIV